MDRTFEMYKLKNGLRIMHIPFPKTNVVFINMTIRCGTVDEDKNTLEYAHFLEHVQANYTSDQYPSSDSIIRYLENHGAETNASTTMDETQYYIKCLCDDTYFLLNLFVLSFVEFHLDEDIFESEREATISELIRNYSNNPWNDLQEKIDAKIYGSHPYGQSNVDKRIRCLQKATPKSILAFRKKKYDIENMLLTISGDISTRELRQMFTMKKYNLKSSTITSNQLGFDGPIIVYSNSQDVQSVKLQLVWVVPISPFHNLQKSIMEGLNSVLTKGFRSRLMYRLRTQLKAIYNISSVLETNPIASTYCITTEVQAKNVILVVREILSILRSLKKSGITEEEYELVQKVGIVRKFDSYRSTKLSKYVNQYAHYMLWEQPVLKFEDMNNLFMQISYSQVQELCRNIFTPERMILGYAGGKNVDEQLYKVIENEFFG